MAAIAEGPTDERAEALCERISVLAAAGLALEPILEEVLLRWSGIRLTTIESARCLADEAARAGDEVADRTAFLLGLVGRTGLFA